MNRRSFLGSLALLTAGMALDPERALWVPGRKTILDLHTATRLTPPLLFRVGDIITVEGHYAVDPRTRLTLPHLQSFLVTADHYEDEAQIELHPVGRPAADRPQRPVCGQLRIGVDC